MKQRIETKIDGDQISRVRTTDVAGYSEKHYQGELDPRLRDSAQGISRAQAQVTARLTEVAELERETIELNGQIRTAENVAALARSSRQMTENWIAEQPDNLIRLNNELRGNFICKPHGGRFAVDAITLQTKVLSIERLLADSEALLAWHDERITEAEAKLDEHLERGALLDRKIRELST